MLFVMSLALLTSCKSGDFIHNRESSAETFYGDIEFGMSRADVKSRVPEEYAIIDESDERIVFSREGVDETLIFVFDKDALIMTDHQQHLE